MGQTCPKIRLVNGSEFLRKIRRLGRRRNILVRVERQRGKGSHRFLFVEDRCTTVKDVKKEIGAGLLAKMLRDLDLSKDDL